ncbi:carbonate dehydratase [Bifidobacterium aemilianum]|uniref:Carbonic anhydrase n=2 Tax=Bifidobacterium aemilianum TaxID=2493120 RepID=A0A366K9P2_9BIFI|nr:carbonic anhydrase [Bifidobacterium aemilianum]RBP97962.1 carbonate dehydratase [Bifidobacterium aemilianum]
MLAGNRRFAEGKAEHPWQDRGTRESLLDRQQPDTAVLACSDSRVPPEIIFDQGLGDLFTVRTAGQMLDDAVIASLEYAVTDLQVSLLVVMGHEGCGAVASSIEELGRLARETAAHNDGGDVPDSDSLWEDEAIAQALAQSGSTILQSVGASVLQAKAAGLHTASEIEQVHVAASIEALVTRSPIIQEALSRQELQLVGARYQMSTGKVEVLSF